MDVKRPDSFFFFFRQSQGYMLHTSGVPDFFHPASLSLVVFFVFCWKEMEMVTLWFKSSLCFSTLVTFDSSFFLLLPYFFSLSARFCQTMSYMQGYTLSRQGLRAYKVNGPWLKQVWSCNRMGKQLWSVAKAVAAAAMWIYVQWMCGLNLQTINKGGTPFEY